MSLGGAQPVALGVVLTALTVAFLWLERLPLRPGLGIAAMLALAVAGALPLASAADGEDPWFDYKSFAEGFGPDEPLAFDWDHSYGPSTWPREGAEVLRVATTRPSYWKMRNLDDFDGEQWLDGGERLGGSDPEIAMPDGWQAQARLARDGARDAAPDPDARGARHGHDARRRGLFPDRRAGGRARRLAIAHRAFAAATPTPSAPTCPRPSPKQLAESGAGADPRRAADLNLTVPVEGDASAGRSADDRGRDPLPAIPAGRRRPDPVRRVSDARALARR